jgi:signal transduction histidine kinase
VYDDARALPLFTGVSDEQLHAMVAAAEEMHLAPGEVAFQQGEPADHWFVLLSGSCELLRTVGREETVLGLLDVPGRWAGGFRAWDAGAGYLATGRCATEARLMRVPSPALRELMNAWFPFAVHLVNGIYGTARSVEANARQRDSLVTLGTLAAGLAHELNNPAAAAVRGVEALDGSARSLFEVLGALAEGQISAEQFLQLEQLRRRLSAHTGPRLTGMAAADREEELGAWLDDHGIDEAWSLAPVLAAAGADLAWCEEARQVFDERTLGPGLAWVAGSLTLAGLLREVRDATGRISELVASVRSYTQMDRAAAQPLDVVDGLESTLVMLGHKVGDIDVVRDYAAGLPRIEGFPGELNQVWTNAIDNALDAMDGSGQMRLSVQPSGDGVVVEVSDTGSGLDDVAAARAFDAFFTTKEVGRGTGLGLDIARRIVVERHGGTIELVREGDVTVLRVTLPG